MSETTNDEQAKVGPDQIATMNAAIDSLIEHGERSGMDKAKLNALRMGRFMGAMAQGMPEALRAIQAQSGPLLLSQEEVNDGTFTDTPWNSERAIGALNVWRWYELRIASGELIRRDQLEADNEVGIDCGHHFRHFSIGRHKYSKKIPEAEYNELLRRGAKIVEG